MDLVFIIAAAFVGGIIVGVAVEHYFVKPNESNGKEIQKVIDKIDTIISDIKSTI